MSHISITETVTNNSVFPFWYLRQYDGNLPGKNPAITFKVTEQKNANKMENSYWEWAEAFLLVVQRIFFSSWFILICDS